MKSIALSAFFVLAAASSGVAGDADAGKAVFRKCVACHTTDPVNRVGPSLAGIVGRPVASFPDYSYSSAMVAFGKGKVWDEALIADYLAAPRAMVPGTAMAFAGLKKPQDIADIIAFLKGASAAQ
ncbi:c-type cytochrome [Mycoplana rhizolycopersici]|uniref:Cytochrome c family protein n=1 Tax=Mycoplana rhizolycopersici TaxID=2746702 RepID=A0ABX2QLH7_9HYPH|nr:cytochrome c family protein [Rhizobium rhizolycopersici]NVP58078.1 cytochrome c family protein [Rhizobium rhizolycopersici]